MDTFNKRTVKYILCLALLSGVGFTQTKEMTVARLDYIKILANRYNELSAEIERATMERARLEGQISLLQAMKNDSLRIPIQ